MKPVSANVAQKLRNKIIINFPNTGSIISKYAKSDTTLGIKKNAILLMKKFPTKLTDLSFIMFKNKHANSNIIPNNDPGIAMFGTICFINKEIISPIIKNEIIIESCFKNCIISPNNSLTSFAAYYVGYGV